MARSTKAKSWSFASTAFALIGLATAGLLAEGKQGDLRNKETPTSQSCALTASTLQPKEFVLRALGGDVGCVDAEDKTDCCKTVKGLFGEDGLAAHCLCNKVFFSELIFGLPTANGIHPDRYSDMLLDCGIPVTGQVACPGNHEETAAEPLIQAQSLQGHLLTSIISAGTPSFYTGIPVVYQTIPTVAAAPTKRVVTGGKKAATPAPAPAPAQTIVIEETIAPQMPPAAPKATAQPVKSPVVTTIIAPKATAGPVVPPVEIPESVPEEMPEVKITEPEARTPVEVPEEKPEEIPEEVPEVPEETPEEIPEEVPEIPVEKPEEIPEEVPEIPKEVPETPVEVPEIPVEKPEEIPEEVPEIPVEKPEEIPEELPELPKETPEEVPEQPGCKSVAAIVSETDDLSILLQLVQATGLTDALGDGFSGTVFAPTNQAFTNLLNELGMKIDVLLDPNSKELVAKILSLHVVSGSVLRAADLSDGQSLTTLLGGDEPLEVSTTDGVRIRGPGNASGVQVVTPDVEACNSVAHIIDNVLIPSPRVSATDGGPLNALAALG